LIDGPGSYHNPDGTNGNSTEVIEDNYLIRTKSAMHTALAEWYIIGEATYCMSPSIEQSTFSKTAVARGDCKYISYHYKDKCDVEKHAIKEKEIFLKTRLEEKLYFDVPKVKDDDVWKSIKMYRKDTFEQCLPKDTPEKAIFEYWQVEEEIEEAIEKEERDAQAAFHAGNGISHLNAEKDIRPVGFSPL